MYRSLIILEGPSPEPADQRVVLTTADPTVLHALGEVLRERVQEGLLDPPPEDVRQLLELVEGGEE